MYKRQIVSWFTGDNDIASFGEQLVSFGQSFAAYYNSVSGVDVAKLRGVVVDVYKRQELQRVLKALTVLLRKSICRGSVLRLKQ